MKRLLLLLPILFLSSLLIKAQHCQYDFAAIVVVYVHEKDKLDNIPNLKITMIDSLGNPVLDYKGNEIVFWQNPEKSLTDTNMFKNARRIRYPFANKNYVWVCPNDNKLGNYYLKIEEVGAVSKYNIPKYSKIKLYNSDQFPLCSTYKNENYFTYSGSRLYKPVEVIVEAL